MKCEKSESQWINSTTHDENSSINIFRGIENMCEKFMSCEADCRWKSSWVYWDFKSESEFIEAWKISTEMETRNLALNCAERRMRKIQKEELFCYANGKFRFLSIESLRFHSKSRRLTLHIPMNI